VETERVKICVVGMGRAGTLHAKNLLYQIPQSELIAVVDSIPSQLQKAMSELKGKAKGFTSLTEVLEEVDFDAVIISTSTFTHAGSGKEFKYKIPDRLRETVRLCLPGGKTKD
jgi:predicted dehydrogenase